MCMSVARQRGTGASTSEISSWIFGDSDWGLCRSCAHKGPSQLSQFATPKGRPSSQHEEHSTIEHPSRSSGDDRMIFASPLPKSVFPHTFHARKVWPCKNKYALPFLTLLKEAFGYFHTALKPSNQTKIFYFWNKCGNGPLRIRQILDPTNVKYIHSMKCFPATERTNSSESFQY